MTDLTRFKNCFAHKNAIYLSTTEGAKPCCWFEGGTTEPATWKEYQDDISKVDIAKGCAHCIKAEGGGSEWSHRKLYQDKFYRDHGNVFLIGVCFDNICNIKCTTCNPTSSSQWIDDYDKLEFWGKSDINRRQAIRMSKQAPDKIALIKDVIENVSFDILKFEFYGGEPLINPTVLKFIDWLAESPHASKIALNFTSNGTTYLQNMDHYLTVFRSVSMQCSIDGITDKFEYLRFLAKWSIVETNLKKYYEISVARPDKFRFGMNYTLSWMNAADFGDYCRWVATTFPDLSHMSQYISKLSHPIYYSSDNLSPEQKAIILVDNKAKIDAIPLQVMDESDGIHFDKLYTFFETSLLPYQTEHYKDPGVIPEGLAMMDKLDIIRHTDYKNLFEPILTQLGHNND